MRLSDYAVGKDNNFTLLRLIAAAIVVFTHSVAVLGLPWIPDVLLSRFGRTIGEMCLDMLFVTSGFLVTASLLTRPNLIEFFWARTLRLYPGALGHASADGFLFGAVCDLPHAGRIFQRPADLGISAEMRDRLLRHSLHASRGFSVAALEG